MRNMVKRVCKHCKKMFKTSQDRVNFGRGIFCSKQCYYNSCRSERVCKRCGKSFVVTLSKVELGEGIFCSQRCQFPIVEKICICGVKFRVRHNAKFCSKKCFHKHKPTKPPAERFWKHVKKGKGCWIWTRAKNNKGYGTFGISTSKNVLAHRFSYELKNGKIKNGLLVLHKCDNPACVNPDHLFLGTAEDNTRDMCEKGRQKSKFTKLNKKLVVEIKKLKGKITNVEIAKRFNLNPSHVGYIMRGVYWKNVK